MRLGLESSLFATIRHHLFSFVRVSERMSWIRWMYSSLVETPLLIGAVCGTRRGKSKLLMVWREEGVIECCLEGRVADREATLTV